MSRQSSWPLQVAFDIVALWNSQGDGREILKGVGMDEDGVRLRWNAGSELEIGKRGQE